MTGSKPVPDLTDAIWRKSSRSSGGPNGECVEVADNLTHFVGVRDSKDRDGAVLSFRPAAWGDFVAGVKAGEFDRRP